MACTPDFSEPHAALERISQLEAEIESLRKQNSRLLDALLDALPHATPQPIFVPYAPSVPAPPLVPYTTYVQYNGSVVEIPSPITYT